MYGFWVHKYIGVRFGQNASSFEPALEVISAKPAVTSETDLEILHT